MHPEIPLDAIPDLSDTQVIIYSRWDRSPDIIEDQVTYPIISALLGAPKVKAIRGFSDFGFSYVYIIFKDGRTSTGRAAGHWNICPRSRPPPQGVKTELGPDATGVGWVYQYALVDKTGSNDLAELRTFQDWYLRYALQSVPGVAEVASIGGFQKQYQVNGGSQTRCLPTTFRSRTSSRRSGRQQRGRRAAHRISGAEYMVRGRGLYQIIEDIEKIVVGQIGTGTPSSSRTSPTSPSGPRSGGALRISTARATQSAASSSCAGENALNVIERVKAKIEELKPSLPEGVEIVTTYDRSELIKRAIDTLKHELIEEMIIVSLVILFFLWHFPSAIVPIVTIPISVLLSFIPMYRHGAHVQYHAPLRHRHLDRRPGGRGHRGGGERLQEARALGAEGRKGDFHVIRLEALKEVGPSVFFSLLVIAVSFLPIFTLVDQEGRLFKPLAYTKNLAMAIAAILAITLDPAMRMLFTRMDHCHFRPRWLSRLYQHRHRRQVLPRGKASRQPHPLPIYEPACRLVLEHPEGRRSSRAVLLMLHRPGLFPARLRVHAAA